MAKSSYNTGLYIVYETQGMRSLGTKGEFGDKLGLNEQQDSYCVTRTPFIENPYQIFFVIQ